MGRIEGVGVRLAKFQVLVVCLCFRVYGLGFMVKGVGYILGVSYTFIKKESGLTKLVRNW